MLIKRLLIKIKHLPTRSRTTLALWLGAALVGLVAFLLATSAEWSLAAFTAIQQK